jgi:hypothetical protein
MASPIEVPKLSYDALRRRADDFLRTHHPTYTIPIPMDGMAGVFFCGFDSGSSR